MPPRREYSRSQAGDEGQLGFRRGRHPRHYGKMIGIQKERERGGEEGKRNVVCTGRDSEQRMREAGRERVNPGATSLSLNARQNL